MSALAHSGLDNALRSHTANRSATALLDVPTIHRRVRELLSPESGMRAPTPSRIGRAATIVRDQLTAHLSTPGPSLPGFYSVSIAAARVLAALSSSAAVRDRWRLVHEIQDLMHHGRFPHDHGHPSLLALRDACYRSGSHAGALAALSLDIRLSLVDWKLAVGMMARTRFSAHNFMTSHKLAEFVVLYEARGGVVDGSLFIAYIKGLSVVVSSLRHPEEALALSEEGGTSRHVVFERIRMTLRSLEHDILPQYPAVSRGSVFVALLRLYLHLPHRYSDIQRAWAGIKASPLHFQTKAVSTLQRYPLDAVSELWEDYLTADIVPSPEDWDVFALALRNGGAYAGQVRALVDRIPDYPEVRAVMASVAPDVGDLERAAEALLEHATLPVQRVARILRYVHGAQRRLAFLIPQSERPADIPRFLRRVSLHELVAARRADECVL
ncbi:hypothetical protein AURDEDRAFT_188841 [Auricularia subglabra TFB-10046 SS5]|uniref:Uncharacterized protein n=1 Tax=Auricularia subglabra (strain TFB-10046 / SS5) TaxID=717982 RepID=J0WR09_AURST|nr:hypothetical protein AURDEDRAFT_188841 [Auricularia subglabra TFB-10046 SS5]